VATNGFEQVVSHATWTCSTSRYPISARRLGLAFALVLLDAAVI
jgi:hypothetical protein